jgi:hypothetical protein
MARNINWRIAIQAGLGKKGGHILKILRTKRAGGVAEAVERLPEFKPQGSFLTYLKKKKEKKRFTKAVGGLEFSCGF